MNIKRKTACHCVDFGCTSCPNDTFCFELLPQDSMRINLYDIETLNCMAVAGHGPPVSKISAASLPLVVHNYTLLRAGSAFAYRGGPKLVSKRPMTIQEAYAKTIFIPGLSTTAYKALTLLQGEPLQKCAILSSDIIPALLSGQIEVALVIHEPLAVSTLGLYEIADLGLEYQKKYLAPLPLGVIVAKRSLGTDHISHIENCLVHSIQTARKRKSISTFVRRLAPHLSHETILQHVESYVGDETEWLSSFGKQSIDLFCSKIS